MLPHILETTDVLAFATGTRLAMHHDSLLFLTIATIRSRSFSTWYDILSSSLSSASLLPISCLHARIMHSLRVVASADAE